MKGVEGKKERRLRRKRGKKYDRGGGVDDTGVRLKKEK
jgi:hypothetical protein